MRVADLLDRLGAVHDAARVEVHVLAHVLEQLACWSRS